MNIIVKQEVHIQPLFQVTFDFDT